MRRLLHLAALTIGLLPIAAVAQDHRHTIMPADQGKWVAAPPSYPKGAEFMMVSGDLSKAEPFVVRIKMPNGYKVPPHTHTGTENVTVLSGTLNFGMGDKLDEKKTEALKPGGYAQMPPGMQHYVWASEPTVVQVHGMGPSGINYVNPADDPRKTQ